MRLNQKPANWNRIRRTAPPASDGERNAKVITKIKNDSWDNNMPKTNLRNHRKQNLPVLLLVLQICAVTAVGQNLLNIKMNVDATEAPRNVLRTNLTIPVKPGPLTLFYPK